MTTTHDTAAALEAAIDAYGNATAREAENADERTALHRAITAHVEAEVARRLEAAPGVDEAIGDFDDACSSLMRVRCEETPPDAREPAAWDESLLEVYRERKAALLAAIAADKARAVEAESIAAIDEFRRILTAPRPPGLPCPVCKVARPTPDEARRLVEDAMQAAWGLSRRPGLTPAEREAARGRATAARTALLRALGVEA